MDFGAMINRAIRAAKLDVNFYNEAEADTSLTQEALMVVIVVSILSGIGSFLATLFTAGIGQAFLALIFGVIMGIIGYYIWSYITYFVGTNLFHGTANVGELLRTLGYASAPQVLGVLAFIPCVGAIAGLVGAIWSLVAGVVAVRESLDFDNTKAILTVIIGWIIVFVISLVIGMVVGVGAAGTQMLTSTLSGG